ncbi:MAG TPA: amidohydrolase, partial [Bacillota bacterium]
MGTARLLLAEARLITGDGCTDLPRAAVVIEGQRIAGIVEGDAPAEFDGRVLDLRGFTLLPGLINHHAHGITTGPLFASAAPPLALETARRHLDQHLAAGVTTLLNLDGFALPDEVAAVADGHPCRVRTATVHLPGHLTAAEAVDGRGLSPRHRRFSLEEAIAAGAVAVGEVGSGHTLGGGGQEYMYIPEAIERATGCRIEPLQARLLKEAVLGRTLTAAGADRPAVKRALQRLGLEDRLDVDQAIELVRQTVLPAYRRALAAFPEAAEAALRWGLPLIVHNSAPSRQVVAELSEDPRIGIPAGLRLIAGHSNHDTFTVEEAINFARWLRERGALIDVSTFDAFGRRHTTDSPAHLLAMVREGVVDTLSTDYGGGAPDPMLVAIRELVAAGCCSLPQAVALATSNVARALPELAPERRLIRRGAVADLIWVDAGDVACVRGVIIGGTVIRMN